MGDSAARTLAFCLLLGLVGTAIGGYQCVNGHNYRIAAEDENTVVGRIVPVTSGTSHAYHYVFSVNGVKMDDYSDVCRTPLAPDACKKYGPVLVYYSYQPFQNSRLEDFSVASAHAYRIGKFALAMGLPFLIPSTIGIANQARKDRREGNHHSENE
jgi:hypothetical protein